MQIQKKHPSLLFFILSISYVFIGSFVVYKYQHPEGGNLFDIGFCYGPVIKNIVTNNIYGAGIFKALRMPLIPLFLSAIAFIYNNLLFAYLIKNLISFILLFICIYITVRYSPHIKKYILWLIMIYALSFPQLLLHGFSIEYEEGYLVSLMSFLFVNAVYARAVNNKYMFFAAAIVNSIVFLAKSSMLILSIGVCFLYYLVTKRRRIFFAFLSILLISILAWGLFNLYNSGKFSVGCSLNGYAFYKGNNERTLVFYPSQSIDCLTPEVSQLLPNDITRNEWDIDRFYFLKAFKFITDNPVEEIKLILVRFYAIFFRIANVVDENSDNYILLRTIGGLYMLVFRIMLIGCIYIAAKDIFLNKTKALTQAERSVAASYIYLGFIFLYNVYYLLGFAHQRHTMPMVPVTLFYLVWVLENRAYRPAAS